MSEQDHWPIQAVEVIVQATMGGTLNVLPNEVAAAPTNSELLREYSQFYNDHREVRVDRYTTSLGVIIQDKDHPAVVVKAVERNEKKRLIEWYRPNRGIILPQRRLRKPENVVDIRDHINR